MSKYAESAKSSANSAIQDYDKLMDPSAQVPAPPVYAARLNGLLKTLNSADGALADSVKARKDFNIALEKLLATSRAILANDENQSVQLGMRKQEAETKKSEVELAIMRGLGPIEKGGSPADGGSASPVPEPDRPEVEALTPPAMDSETPQGSPAAEALQSPPAKQVSSVQPPAASGIEMLSNLASQYQALPISTNGSNKRRRVESDDFPDLEGDDGIDEDVAEMLRKDGAHA